MRGFKVPWLPNKHLISALAAHIFLHLAKSGDHIHVSACTKHLSVTGQRKHCLDKEMLFHCLNALSLKPLNFSYNQDSYFIPVLWLKHSVFSANRTAHWFREKQTLSDPCLSTSFPHTMSAWEGFNRLLWEYQRLQTTQKSVLMPFKSLFLFQICNIWLFIICSLHSNFCCPSRKLFLINLKFFI